jgi:UDP-N-acetyl-D-mannosaminuronic acid dehydrogenase
MTPPFRTVSVIGLGYIGLPTAAILATHGFQVLGVDVNPDVVQTINLGKPHIVEPELDAMLQGVVSSGRFRASTQPSPADAFIIAVPTPFREGHKPDLSFIRRAADSIAPLLARGNLVILESTSPVGTTQKLAQWFATARPDLSFPQQAGDSADVHLAYCPERVLPGRLLHELVSNDRVIGGMSRRCSELTVSLYAAFVKGQCVVTDPRTAELTKLTENSYRDVNIAFANELSLICAELNVDVWELISLANRHPRVRILQPGPGVGGHCIAVDPWFVVDSAPELSRLIRTAREVNDSKPHHVVAWIRERAARFHRPVIACLGLAFKADIDDFRESPAIEVVRQLALGDVGELLVVEPFAAQLPPLLGGLAGVRLTGIEQALERADVIVLLVGHRLFRSVDRRLLQGKVVIDACGAWR